MDSCWLQIKAWLRLCRYLSTFDFLMLLQIKINRCVHMVNA